MSANEGSRRGRWVSLGVFAVINVIFLSLAFGAGYVVRAVTTDRDWWQQLAGASDGERYPILAEARLLLEAHYIGELPDDRVLEYGAARGLVASVGDPYTVFVEPQAHELASQDLAGEYGGIGVTIKANEAGEIVLSPYRESPAASEASMVCTSFFMSPST